MSDAPRRRILICDDQPLLRQALRRMITETWPNCDFTEAEDGLRAEEILQRDRFDVVFMDIEMPLQNGLRTLDNLAQSQILADTPVVLCTGCKGETQSAHDWKTKVAFHVEKPFTSDRIYEVLDGIKWRNY